MPPPRPNGIREEYQLENAKSNENTGKIGHFAGGLALLDKGKLFGYKWLSSDADKEVNFIGFYRC